MEREGRGMGKGIDGIRVEWKISVTHLLKTQKKVVTHIQIHTTHAYDIYIKYKICIVTPVPGYERSRG